MNEESESDYTKLLLGMHKHLNKWWQDVHARTKKTLPDEKIICITDSHTTAADRAKYGLDFVLQVCLQGEMRISNLAVPYGVMGPAEGPGRTLLPWFVRIPSDHHTLEVKEMGTWEELAATHRDRVRGSFSRSKEMIAYDSFLISSFHAFTIILFKLCLRICLHHS